MLLYSICYYYYGKNKTSNIINDVENNLSNFIKHHNNDIKFKIISSFNWGLLNLRILNNFHS